MKKYLLNKHTLTVLLLQPLFAVNSFAHPDIPKDTLAPKRTLDYIDPTIGNIGALLEPTRPTVSLPNQMVRMYPIRKDYLDDRISSFPLTMISHRLGEAFAIKPCSSAIDAEGWNRRMPYDHDLEITRPWY